MVDLQSILEAITIMPFILIYISLLMKLDDYLDRQIEMQEFTNTIDKYIENVLLGIKNELIKEQN